MNGQWRPAPYLALRLLLFAAIGHLYWTFWPENALPGGEGEEEVVNNTSQAII